MLDIKFIKENKDLVEKHAKDKGIKIDISRLLDLDQKRRDLIQKTENLRSEQKKLAKEDIQKAKSLKIEFCNLEEELKKIEIEFKKLMLLVPNIHSKDSPIGKDESENVIIEKWGKIPEFKFPIKDHVQLGHDLDLIDLEIGTKVSGFRGYFLKNDLVRLERAILSYALDKLAKKGFQIMRSPTLIKEFTLEGSGHFPFGSDNIYQVANPNELTEQKKEEIFLAGTSESPLLAYWSDKTIEEKSLPKKMAGISACYRSEIGSYGKDTKGLYRVHEFFKVEQVIICSPEQSEKIFKELEDNAKEMLKDFNLPYRVKEICTGDMGAPKFKMRDIETWMPSRNDYGETHSNSNLSDWQARRLNIKIQKNNDEKIFAHTLNNTMVASPRILIAAMENWQQKDGSIKIPKTLQKYTGFSDIKPPKK